MLVLIYFVCAISLVVAKNEEYSGHKVYKVTFEKQNQQDAFYALHDEAIDYWRRPSLFYNMPGLVMVPPLKQEWFENVLRNLTLAKEVYIDDVSRYLFNLEKSKRQSPTNFSLNGFHRYDTILDYLKFLETQINDPQNVTVELFEFEKTIEDRQLIYVMVSNTLNAPKPIIIIEAAINPREWITVPAALNVINKLIEVEQRRLIDEFDWIIIPVLNPDGYEYTHTNLRLWSKSRSTQSHLGFICPGVNLNRNFDIDWLKSDSSTSPCSHLYAGEEAFSEIETQMVASILQEYGDNIKLYISLQNKGGYITYPWNFEKAASGMFREHHLLGLEMIKAMSRYYNLGVASVAFDRISGTSTDFVRKNGVLYNFNIDIVQSNDGVIFAEDDVSDIIDDVWRAIEVAANYIL